LCSESFQEGRATLWVVLMPGYSVTRMSLTMGGYHWSRIQY
jgi:hypothetical protein